MSIFGRWFRANGHDALSSIDMEATRAAVQRDFEADLATAAAKARASVEREREKLVQERKEQSILAALVFGCSCGARWYEPPPSFAFAGALLAEWLRTHARCAGLGAMVREDA